MPQAVEEMRQVVKILPNRALYRENLALYADYSGDFQTAEQEIRAMAKPGLFALLALAFAQVGQGQVPAAAETYRGLSAVDDEGRSYTQSGLADLAVYEGRYADAEKLLKLAADEDLKAKIPDKAASKFAALAGVRSLQQKKTEAVGASEQALANSQAVKIRFLAAQALIEAGSLAKARALSKGLASELQAEPQAYAAILEGLDALSRKDARQAIKLLTTANTMLDTWIGHYHLGRAYLEAGVFPQADSEFDRCLNRRGEALALFLDEEPTYGIFPNVYYYQGRVREGLKSTNFADSYRAYLAIRGASTDDPFVAEARRRAGK